MAFSSTVTLTNHGGRKYTVKIQTTEDDGTAETAITGLPLCGTLLSQMGQLHSGTGTTIDPILGTATDPATNYNNIVIDNGTAAAGISNLASPAIRYATTDGTLYARSVCDSGADNVVEVTLVIMAGW